MNTILVTTFIYTKNHDVVLGVQQNLENRRTTLILLELLRLVHSPAIVESSTVLVVENGFFEKSSTVLVVESSTVLVVEKSSTDLLVVRRNFTNDGGLVHQ